MEVSVLKAFDGRKIVHMHAFSKVLEIASSSLLGHTTIMAAITEGGDCFSWGDTFPGSLGHGSECRQKTPRIIASLFGLKMIDVQGELLLL